jgi:hypothetical protein
VAARTHPAAASRGDINEDNERVDPELDVGDANTLRAEQMLKYLANVHWDAP